MQFNFDELQKQGPPPQDGGKGGAQGGAQGGQGGDAAKDGKKPAKKQPKTPMIFYAWGAMSTWLLVDGYLTYNAYTSYASDLVTNKLSGTTWTTSTVQSTAPVSYWLYSSYLAMGLQSVSVLGWIMGAMGNKKSFFKIAKMAMLFPLIEAAMWLFTYFSYTACSSTTSTQFDGSTSSVTQLSSCSSPTSTATITGYFSTTGTWAPYVSTDPLNTWFATNLSSAGAMVVTDMMLQKYVKKVVAMKKKQAKQKQEAKDKAAKAKPAADAAATPAPAAPEPAPAAEPEPAPAPEPEPEPAPAPPPCRGWGCL